MHISSLLVRDFRLIEDITLSLQEGVLLFLGKNAQGKTSLIEAILFLATSTSHRTRKEEELIRWNSQAAYIRADIERDGSSLRLECGLEKNRKHLKRDGNPLPRVKDIYGLLPTVLLVPEDIIIIDGSPQERRRFIDMAIAQIDPDAISILQKYRRLLKHRNQSLKKMQEQGRRADPAELRVWNQTFLELACQIIHKRALYAKDLSPLLQENYAHLAQEGELTFSYPAGEGKSLEEIKVELTKKLEKIERAEIERGATLFGPHRDDFYLHLQDKNIAVYGSQGQRRGAVLALRLAQAKICLKKTGMVPILLIDDVVYEMDNDRRSRFWKLVDPSGQVIVTATELEHLGTGVNPTTIFKVDHGKICHY